MCDDQASPSMVLEKRCVVENEQPGIVIDKEEMVGQIVSEGNFDASDICDRPSIKGLGEPYRLATEFGRFIEQPMNTVSQWAPFPSQTTP